jgi:hypothetical protein
MVYQNAPKLLRGYREEMGSILPLHGFRGTEPQVQLIHQSARLERVIPSFLPQVATSHTTKFFIRCFHNPITSLFISGTPSNQQ